MYSHSISLCLPQVGDKENTTDVYLRLGERMMNALTCFTQSLDQCLCVCVCNRAIVIPLSPFTLCVCILCDCLFTYFS